MLATVGGCLVALLASAVFGVEVRAKIGQALERRADNNTTIPAAISVAPSQYWDGNDGPWSSFPYQIGGGNVQKQTVRLFPSTAAYNTWVIDATIGCPQYYFPDCNNARGFTYNYNNSLTWVPISPYNLKVESNLFGDSSGEAGFDDITVGWQGEGGPTVDHSVLFAIANTNFWIGLFGLNPLPTNFSTFNNPQPSFMSLLAGNDTVPSKSYGYTAGNQYRFNKVYGSLTLGGYDQNRFAPTETTFQFGSDISRDLLVNIKSITTDKSTSNDQSLLPDSAISAFLDSSVAEIWLPQSACTAFENAFNLTYNETVSRYLVDNTTRANLQALNPTVTFALTNGSQEVAVSLPYEAFDLQVSFPIVANGTTSYYFPLQRAADESQYTLGRTFFQEAFLIADYDRGNFTVAPCTWDQQKLQNTDIVSILSPNWTNVARERSSSSSSSSFPAGAIAGVVVGVIALIAILGLILFFIRRRKNRTKRERAAELEAKSSADAKLSDGSIDGQEGKPFISAPIGGELGGDGEIHEMTAPHKPVASELDSPYRIDPGKVGYSEVGGGEFYGGGGKYGGRVEAEGSTPIYEMEGGGVPVSGRRGSGYRSDIAKR